MISGYGVSVWIASRPSQNVVKMLGWMFCWDVNWVRVFSRCHIGVIIQCVDIQRSAKWLHLHIGTIGITAIQGVDVLWRPKVAGC